MQTAYRQVEMLAFNSDILTMETERQTPILASTAQRNSEMFELFFIQGMDGMQTGRSSGNLGYRGDRWWFTRMMSLRRPFVSESYFSVTSNMPVTSVFYPMMNGPEMIGIMAADIKLSGLSDLLVETASEGSFVYILDGSGVITAHPDRSLTDDLYNYSTLTRTVTRRDAAGNPLWDAAGVNHLTDDLPIIMTETYRAAITNMMRGNSGSTRVREDGSFLFVSYMPVQMEGYSDPWYVISVKDGNIAMSNRNTVMTAILGSLGVISIAALYDSEIIIGWSSVR
jgi:methyl-accepting chemotaxis protein